MSETEYTTIYPKADKTTYYSHSSTYSIVYNEDGKPSKTILNHTPVCHDDCAYTIKYDDSSTVMDKLDIQTKDVVIHFKDGESASYNNAYDLQEAFNTVVNKLLEVKPELNEWVEINFKKYLTTEKL